MHEDFSPTLHSSFQFLSFAFLLKLIVFATTIVVSFVLAASAQSQTTNSQTAQILSLFPALSDQPSEDTKSILFSIGGTNYKVPRNYLINMENWGGGPQTQVRFKVTLPDLKPLSDTTKDCLSSDSAGQSQGCIPFEFWVVSGGRSDDAIFSDQLKRFSYHPPIKDPSGFDVYEKSLPKSGEVEGMEIYRKVLPSRSLILFCTHYRQLNGTRGVYCENNYGSPLSNGNGINYRIGLDQIVDIEHIDVGIRNLVQSFTLKGNTQ